MVLAWNYYSVLFFFLVENTKQGKSCPEGGFENLEAPLLGFVVTRLVSFVCHI